MLTQHLLQNRSSSHVALSVCGVLAARQTLSLHPRSAGVVRVTQGRLWLTLDGPHTGHANAWGDMVLYAGQSMTLCGGQRLLMEAWPLAGVETSQFEWQPAPTVSGRIVATLREALRSLQMLGSTWGSSLH